MRNLYLLTTKELGKFFIVAKSSSEAEERLKEDFLKASYGFDRQQKVTNIEILGHEIGEFPAGKPNFSSGNNLIIHQ